MRLLLDTHAFLWWLADDPRLSAEAKEAISEARSIVHVSTATIWEISIKANIGKANIGKANVGRIDLGGADLALEISANGFVELPITARHAMAAGGLPRHHDDPFDRMLIAQAQAEGLAVVTHDTAFRSYDVSVRST